MKVAIIPARGGSKRIPRKNIKEFCGKPMISWSIVTALDSGCFDRVVVSTDDEEIARVARTYGAEVPFMRPASLSDDHTATIPVIKHAIEWLARHQKMPEQVCCIYATAPFIRAEDLQRGLQQLNSTGAAYAFTVTSYAFPIQRAFRISADEGIEMFYPEYFETRSQDLEEAWHDAGQFYWGRADAWIDEKMIFEPESTPIILPRYRVQDIDTLEDWRCAEWMFKALQLNAES
ncbi:pseudaminic acid cytidylyltransferase [Marinobacterium nitratireducens]|uniref:Pseudaminic acid cytidylyltransferase n=1 Tax=Marinobacterium nitratireducens TaxID=518897 RepID=A0A918DVZ7_9GAMM|nr:pseudaminic acid cytidylyltransferase [Marinobacterium nitratireducens]GGO85139.1 pseudaminic acid cytidylyltransferase [Marinobacterium nitratireducens]